MSSSRSSSSSNLFLDNASFFSNSNRKLSPCVALTASVSTLVASVLWYVSLVRRRKYEAEEREHAKFMANYAEQLHALEKDHDEDSTDESRSSTTGCDLPESPVSGRCVGAAASAKIKVVYGSATGTAHAEAHNLVVELIDRGADAALIDPSIWPHLLHIARNRISKTSMSSKDSLDSSLLFHEESILIFVLSTTGEGDPPEKAVSLVNEIQRAVSTQQRIQSSGQTAANENDKVFSHVQYAVLAFGDSSYKYYCKPGKDVEDAMRLGGAKPLVDLCCVDASKGTRDNVIYSWQEKLMASLSSCPGVVLTGETRRIPLPQQKFSYLPHCEPDPDPFPRPSSRAEPTQTNPIQLPLKRIVPLTERRECDGSYVVRVVVDISQRAIAYEAGDHFGILPSNPPHIAEAYRRILGIDEEPWSTTVELCAQSGLPSSRKNRNNNSFPARVHLSTVFEHYIDLCATPTQGQLRTLAKFCTDPEEQDAFFELLGNASAVPPPNPSSLALLNGVGNAETGMWAMYKLHPDHRTIMDYLLAYPSCAAGMSVPHFLEIMPRIQPRLYSVASDTSTHPGTIELLVRIVPGGLVSTFLEQSFPCSHQNPPEDAAENNNDATDDESAGHTITQRSVAAFVKPSIFHLPSSCNNRPIVLIGAGTGAAPLIGLCHRREASRRRNPRSASGPCVFLFGSQSRSKEYFIRDEVERWSTSKLSQNTKTYMHHPIKPAKPLLKDVEKESSQRNQCGKASLQHADNPLISYLGLAFSRDQPTKRYVTDVMRENGEYLSQLLLQNSGMNAGGCLVYVAGDAKRLAKSVDETLVSVLVDFGGLTTNDAKTYLQRMEKERRYLKDVY